jgi:hypothetical protein
MRSGSASPNSIRPVSMKRNSTASSGFYCPFPLESSSYRGLAGGARYLGTRLRCCGGSLVGRQSLKHRSGQFSLCRDGDGALAARLIKIAW